MLNFLWGDDPFTSLGHTQVPDALIGYAARLGLVPEECWLIVCILKFKHTPDNPYPSQERLAGILGRSADTVRRLLKRIERKGLVSVDRVRGDLGHFTHSVYDFTPLRAALNEAYYRDHPEERPPEVPEATVQNCTVVDRTPQKGPQPPRKIGRNHPAKNGLTTVQICGPKKSLQVKEKKQEKTLNVGPPAAHPQAAPQTGVAGRTSNGGEGVKRLVPERAEDRPKTDRPRDVTAAALEAAAGKIVEHLRDWGSERRHRQLLSICDQHDLQDLPQQALHATERRLAREGRRGVLEKPGAYYQNILLKLLAARQVFVPKLEEAAQTREQLKADLGLPACATLEEMRAALRATLPGDPAPTGHETGDRPADREARIRPQEARQGACGPPRGSQRG